MSRQVDRPTTSEIRTARADIVRAFPTATDYEVWLQGASWLLALFRASCDDGEPDDDVLRDLEIYLADAGLDADLRPLKEEELDVS